MVIRGKCFPQSLIMLVTCFVSRCLASLCFSYLFLSVCQRRTCVSGRPVRRFDMEKVPRLQRRWRRFTSMCKVIRCTCRNTDIQSGMATLIFFVFFCVCVCGSETSWLLELPVGSTSIARQWIKRWRGSDGHIVLSWMTPKCTSTFL